MRTMRAINSNPVSVTVENPRIVMLKPEMLMLLCLARARNITKKHRDSIPAGMDFFNAITQAFCTSAKTEFLQGVHEAADTYKIALYVSAATLDASTTAYSATNEVTGTGYTAGGATLGSYAASSSGTTSWIDFADASWSTATITARGALIYNSTQANKAVCVLDFGSDKTSTAGTFTVIFPAADASNALIRLT